jgi:hypothetical protein
MRRSRSSLRPLDRGALAVIEEAMRDPATQADKKNDLWSRLDATQLLRLPVAPPPTMPLPDNRDARKKLYTLAAHNGIHDARTTFRRRKSGAGRDS